MNKKKIKDQEVDRRKFIEKSARDISACGFVLFELAKVIREEVVQVVIDDIKEAIKRP